MRNWVRSALAAALLLGAAAPVCADDTGAPEPPAGIELPAPGVPPRQWLRDLPAEDRLRARDWFRSLSDDEWRALRRRQGGASRDRVTDRPQADGAERGRQRQQLLRDLSPEDRRELRRNWQQMTPDERRAVRRQMQSLAPQQRRELAENIARYRSLPPDQQQALRERMQRFRDRSPAERERIRRNAERWRRMTPVERERIRKNWNRYQHLTPDQRRALQDRAGPPR